jgi:hypothetical protein
VDHQAVFQPVQQVAGEIQAELSVQLADTGGAGDVDLG